MALHKPLKGFNIILPKYIPFHTSLVGGLHGTSVFQTPFKSHFLMCDLNANNPPLNATLQSAALTSLPKAAERLILSQGIN